MLSSKSKRAVDGREKIKTHLLITRYNPERVENGEMLSVNDIQDILRIPVIGVIPESQDVLQASNTGTPAINLTGSDVSDSYTDVIARFLGEKKELRFVDVKKKSLFQRLFKGVR